jgi:hypothetical protein
MIGVYFKRCPDISGEQFSHPGVPGLSLDKLGMVSKVEPFVFFSSNFALNDISI